VARLGPLNPAEPLVRLKEVSIRYGEITIFENLSWTIERNQHWQLTGPNGSGKTGLLSLITGDHPQCYVNDIFVFGFQRGHGESIWQIKQYIGYVSTALHWEYRVSTSVRNVIISGFYDSIGLYSKYTDRQREIANAWLAVLGMSGRADEPFNKLSYGDQRLLLIARSMVKHPPLLILDEPCLGLDDMNRQRVLALIEKICVGSETSVIYVNHHPEDKIAGIEHYLALEPV
jgi:molybdate transport system ATP-binding protein